ncbi:type I-F CRISPR-associated protein Csy3 [Moritella sp. PE36]|uniref:type I-F CRISPR-associated protein Csy3 n=1 Tax=Moritella sp. PE36 TaxID=58051 RepID=UPI0002D44CA0|nr:type I-F CRISPR-associated protein Csy3 [Moritella sp. PE36]
MIPYSQLSYSRTLSPSQGVFYYESEDNEFNALIIESHKTTPSKSGFGDAYNTDGSIKNITPQSLVYANIHELEMCYVPIGVKEVKCRFSLGIEANSLSPTVCDNPQILTLLEELAEEYKARGGYLELATRICKNIFEGNWLWRNQNAGPTSISFITENGSQFIIGNTRDLANKLPEEWPDEDQGMLEGIAKELANAMSDKSIFWSAEITATLKARSTLDIHPSQLFTDQKSSRTLLKTQLPNGDKTTSFSGFKIGAALQSIDNWWSENADYYIRVNEYGADRKRIISLRNPTNKNDFYTYLNQKLETYKSDLEDKSKPIKPEIHYFMSVLLKGGLFQPTKEH